MKRPEALKQVRKYAAEQGDSQALIRAVCRKLSMLDQIDDPQAAYDDVAAELVNNPKSRFYFYG